MVFAPNQRTVAVGTLIGPGTKPAGTLYHTVSGWYGMRGAMMCVLKDEEIKVFGICMFHSPTALFIAC
jgi:hypothetical protein